MQTTDDPDRQVASVRLYLDESGGEDPGTPHAIVGGMLTNESGYKYFEAAWDELLAGYKIEPPLHMREFGKHGRFGQMSTCCRRELFQAVAALINTYKLGSIGASITNSEYQTCISSNVRRAYSVYAMCFNLAVMAIHKEATAHKYPHRISLILDAGNPYKGHVIQAHAVMQKMQKETFLNVGGLYFEDDADFGVLQAADVIAWASRRAASKIGFGYGFEPLAAIFAGNHRAELWITDWLEQLGESLAGQIADAEGTQSETD